MFLQNVWYDKAVMRKKEKKRKRLIMLLALCILCSGCAAQPIEARGFAMDTIVSVTVYQKNEGKTAHAALGELDEWEGQWSSTKEESPIYALNRGETVPVSEDMEAMLRLGQQLESETEGAYTLSIAPLVKVWHIQTRQQEEALPTKAQIQAAMGKCGKMQIKWNETKKTLAMAPGAGLDFGSIAKGRAADKLAAYLQEQGVETALIDLGGNIRAIGERTYTIGLQDPRDLQQIFATIQVKNKNVVTSGDYQRYIEIDTTRYHHILDARTGMPAHSGLISVTIVGEEGMLCDALSTAVFILGKEKGLQLLQAYDVQAVLVEEDKKVTVTDGLKDDFTLQNQAYTVQ